MRTASSRQNEACYLDFTRHVIVAQLRVDQNDIPTWLKDLQEDVARARRRADLGAELEPKLLILMLALDGALSSPGPASASETRDELEHLRNASRRLWKSLQICDVQLSVELVGPANEVAALDGSVEVTFEYDAIGELIAALNLFLTRTEHVCIPERKAGPRPRMQSLAAELLLRFLPPSLPVKAQSQLADAVFFPVFARHKCDLPSWYGSIRRARRHPELSVNPSRPSPKYRNPDNAKEIWSGRGRRPKWLQSALEQGKYLKDFIAKA